jgi:hypothetical protein
VRIPAAQCPRCGDILSRKGLGGQSKGDTFVIVYGLSCTCDLLFLGISTKSVDGEEVLLNSHKCNYKYNITDVKILEESPDKDITHTNPLIKELRT